MFLPRLNISCYVFTYSKSESLQLNRASYEIIRNFTPKQGLIKSDWKLKYSTFNSKVQMNNIYYIKLDVHLKYPLPSHAPRNKKLYLPRDRFCWTCFYLSQHFCQEHHAKSILLILVLNSSSLALVFQQEMCSILLVLMLGSYCIQK